MKKLISFLLCLVVGILSVIISVATNPTAGGKPDIDYQIATLQPFQERTEFEADVGNLERTLTKEKSGTFGHSNKLKRSVIPRPEPETVYRN